MAQSFLKRKPASIASTLKSKPPSAARATSRKQKLIPSKSTVLQQQHQLRRKLTAQINRNIEQQMAVKANSVGKLTIMKKLAQDAPKNAASQKRK